MKPNDLSEILQLIKQNQPLNQQQISILLTTALDKIINHIDLTFDEMQAVMLVIMQGNCPDAMMGAILTALRMKSESIDEISAAASVMRKLSTKVDLSGIDNLVDIVGTGGDGANLFNVSSASMLVAAAAGCHVAKHGSRGVSTNSGSSNLLEQAGLYLGLTPDQTTECIKTQGVGFLYAPNHHTAMKHAMPIRNTLKIRTLFNILGPLTNPAGVKNALIGVFNQKLCKPLAEVYKNLGDHHVMVVASADGLDEISLAASTYVAELKDGQVKTYEILPEDLGIASQTLHGLTVNSPAESLALIKEALAKNPQKSEVAKKAMAMIALNAGATIYVAKLADSHQAGVAKALDVINSGKALEKLENLAKFTQQFNKN
ncbi:anthranilate phosphoribosyltransferase [Moraxella macacae 0408225]|uniref:Anthranilate phosphoribosyltransferase n=1 Tax=Moraxella macacae 0408225 TaxID=1230338 RepID=L2F6J6_9GAMM|nr:anthranilate phosphoribosyltransferase [Moraxella macacae]ELA08689.1 anthranilate phosphoribosyltransferase [Moraxella macacae 0408225]